MPNVFGERAGSAVDPSPVLPQSVPATIALVGGGGLETGEAGAGSRGTVGLALCSLAITALLAVESDHKLLKQSLDVWACSLWTSVPHFPILRPFVPERWKAEASGACENLRLGSGQMAAPDRGPGCLLCAAMVSLTPLRDSSVSPPCPSQRQLSPVSTVTSPRPPPCSHIAGLWGPCGLSACIRG